MDDDELLDLRSAAEHLGVSPTELMRLLDRGLPWHQGADDARLVRRSDLEAHRAERYARQQRTSQQARDAAAGTPDLLPG